MEQKKRLDYLVQYLLAERAEQNMPMSDGYAPKRALFRSLVNLRPPRPISDEFIRIQDEFLQEESREKGIVSVDTMPTCAIDNRISLWQGDITRLKVDAIVNAANSELLGCFVPGHHCIDNAIHTAAGVQLREECYAIMKAQGHPEETGFAKITGGYNLPAEHVIHTVGPIVKGSPTKSQEQELAKCYRSCLELAVLNEAKTIAFCCISTGIFAFPKKLAAQIAVDTVTAFLKWDTVLNRVIFNVFTDEDYDIYRERINRE